MANPKTLRLMASAVAFLICLSLCDVTNGHTSPQTPSDANDEAACRALGEKYLIAFARKDLEGIFGLWNPKSPDLGARKAELRQLFSSGRNVEVRNASLGQFIAGNGKTTLRIAMEVSAIDANTGKPASGTGRLNRALYFTKEEGRWLIQSDASTEDEIARSLIAARNADERASLLVRERDFISAELWQSLSNQARAYYSRGDYQQSLAVLLIAQRVAEVIGDRLLVARTLNNIGLIYRGQGDFNQAFQYFEKSLSVFQALGAQPFIAIAGDNLGIIYSSQGDYARALEYFQKSRAIYEKLGNKIGLAGALLNIGIVHHQQSNFALAMEYYRKALEMSEAAGSKLQSAGALVDIGLAYYSNESYDQAIESLNKAKTLYEELSNKQGIASAFEDLGLCYQKKKDREKALDLHEKSLSLYEAIGDRAGAAVALSNVASVHLARGDHDRAMRAAEQSAALAREAGKRDSVWMARTSAGRAYRALEKPELARQAFEEAIATIEDLRTMVVGGEHDIQRFLQDKTKPYQEMVGLLADQNRGAEALRFAERAKGRVLLDVLRGGKANISRAMTTEQQEEERRLEGQLVSINSELYRERLRPQPDGPRLSDLTSRLEKARLDRESFQTSLYALHPELKLRRGEAPPIRMDEVADLLPDSRTALLEYVVTERKTYLFVLTRNDERKGRQVDLRTYAIDAAQEALDEKVNHFRQRLANHDLDFQPLAMELYGLLLSPARQQLLGKTNVVVVADGVLWELPFQALQSAPDHYLIEDFALSYVPSLTVLREMKRARERHSAPRLTLLAAGNPALGKQTVERVKSVLMDESLEPLPEAEKQVRALGQLYGPAASRIYIGAEAREDVIKAEAGQYRILHLATHGVLNDASPMYSHVVLSQVEGNPAEDGLLEAWEIMNLDLKADLAVLSACETARGKVGPGEGMIGLTWALFVAGCPTTVVSQWKVESASTTELMVEFHKGLKAVLENPKSQVSKAEALRQAELKLLHNKLYRHPFFWAPFVMVGNGT